MHRGCSKKRLKHMNDMERETEKERKGKESYLSLGVEEAKANVWSIARRGCTISSSSSNSFTMTKSSRRKRLQGHEEKGW